MSILIQTIIFLSLILCFSFLKVPEAAIEPSIPPPHVNITPIPSVTPPASSPTPAVLHKGNGQIRLHDFNFLMVLGKGSFGKVLEISVVTMKMRGCGYVK